MESIQQVSNSIHRSIKIIFSCFCGDGGGHRDGIIITSVVDFGAANGIHIHTRRIVGIIVINCADRRS
ncbi:Hypothetical predicted protein [Octopus vulgaris]|uniref:Uncharacterized protein n=1 Tax=Octopus vulgaris TaxID=6645 RepID=A0AA36AXF1_OCTVU|nr:Hypothetical predicted protein [Octopus vulgaris]